MSGIKLSTPTRELGSFDNQQPEPDWKSRYKENVEKMTTGSIFEVAVVLKNLYSLNFQKTLSFREKKMYDRALQLVISEIATVQDETAEDIGEVVEGFLLTSCEQASSRMA